MVISSREFLAAAAALQPGLVPRSSVSIQPSEGGTYPLGFDTHRDGLVYVPGGYRDGTPAKTMCVAGFSDGASYSLSLGIGAGDVFSHVAAFSPGFMTPRDARGTPRIFISHGTSDAVMPIDETSRRFVPALRKLGYDVTFREYEGGHSVPEPVVREAFAWFAE